MGEVFLAEDMELDRKVAIKFLPPKMCQDEESRLRFRREARAIAKLEHSNIVTVYEAGEHTGRPFIVMQYIEGLPLREYMENMHPIRDEILDLALGICSGLQAAHENGVVHRDIKPSNILVDSARRPQIVDFGLAWIQDDQSLTTSGSTLGTSGYMSPEQIRGEEVDSRTDLFSLGIVLYEMIEGKPPFKKEHPAATLHAILNEPAPPITTGWKRMQEIIYKLLSKDKKERYKSASEVINDLKRLKPELRLRISDKHAGMSVAVLPFANLSADPEQEYFCDGMAEELINALAHLENLRVIARTSSFAFKGLNEDVREIGRRLNVENLLEGSVRKAGNRLRINVQLVKAGDGTHLWSDQYDRELADIFAIQNEISTAVVDKLRVRLLGKEKTAITRPHLEHFETYRLYLLGRHHWNSRTPTGLQKAIECFNKVLKLDPEYSLAYSGLADCYNLLEQVWLLPPREAYPMAREMAKKALKLDGSLAEAHASLGLIRFNYDYNTLTAEQELTTALRLKPNYPTAYHWYALMLASMSRFIEAKEIIRKAIELDPLSPAICTGAVFVEFLARDYDKAVELAKNILDMNPEFQFVNLPMAWALAAQGRHEEAIRNHLQVEPSFGHLSEQNYKQLKEAFELNGREGYWSKNAELLEELALSNYVPPTEIATSYSRLGDADHVFEWLERAYEVRDSRLRFLGIDQAFDDYRDDPRMDSLLNRIVPGRR